MIVPIPTGKTNWPPRLCADGSKQAGIQWDYIACGKPLPKLSRGRATANHAMTGAEYAAKTFSIAGGELDGAIKAVANSRPKREVRTAAR